MSLVTGVSIFIILLNMAAAYYLSPILPMYFVEISMMLSIILMIYLHYFISKNPEEQGDFFNSMHATTKIIFMCLGTIHFLSFLFANPVQIRIPNQNDIYTSRNVIIQAYEDDLSITVKNRLNSNPTRYSPDKELSNYETNIPLNDKITYGYVEGNGDRVVLNVDNKKFLVDATSMKLKGEGKEIVLSNETSIYLTDTHILTLSGPNSTYEKFVEVSENKDYKKRLEGIADNSVLMLQLESKLDDEDILINLYCDDNVSISSNYLEVIRGDKHYVVKTNISNLNMLEVGRNED